MIIIFNKWTGRDLSCQFKILCELTTVSKILLPTTIKTLWTATSATSTKDMQIGASFIGVTFPDKLI